MLSEVITRLENAEEGSISLDDAINNALDGNGALGATTSLDIALALAERVLPGWWIEIATKRMPDEHVSMRWLAEVTHPTLHEVAAYGETLQSREFYSAFAPTPALALCIAILRALNLNETRND